MTYENGQPEAFPYPPKPWYDGQTAYKDNEDGSRTVATYEQLNNVWHVEVIADAGLGDYYITTKDVHLVSPRNAQIGKYINELRADAQDDAPDELPLETQSDFNAEHLYATFNQKRKQTRNRTRTDFLQNTIVDDEWEYDAAKQANELPEDGKFHLFDVQGRPNSHWEDASTIVINGTGRNTGNLSQMRRGSVLQIQDVLVNSYVQYVVTGIEFIGSIEGGQFFVTATVTPAYGRAKGLVPDGAVCEIQVLRQQTVITTAGAGQPIVDDDGYLWYNEINQTLYVSDWEDTQDANGLATWIPVGGPGDTSGGGVFVGEFPPTQNLEPGRLWFDTGRLELYVWYEEGEDGGWLPSSPLGARVSAGEALQAEINTRLGTVEGNYLKKTGDTFTGGALRFKRTDDASYWTYITFDTPEAWKNQENTHGVIINIGQTNSYKQQLKIQGRSGNELFKIYDDNKAVANLYGDFTVTGTLKVDGKTIDDTAYVHKKGGTQNKMQGDLYLGGFAIKGVGEPSLSTDAATKAYVDSKGGGPTDKYDSNFYSRSGVSGATLNSGDVMFMNDQLVSTTDPHEIAAIGFCPFDFDWDTCAYSGVIRARSGGRNAGFYQVYDYSLMENRMMILYVSQIKVENGVTLGYESGCPCRFQGVFFE